MKPPIRIMLVEDSPTQAAHIRAALESAEDLSVVTVAASVADALIAVSRDKPDVITMDLEIPGGGGQSAIEQIMRERPTPIVVLSRLIGSASAPEAIEGLAAGAIDALPKPDRWTPADVAMLQRKVRLASGVMVVRRRGARPTPPLRRAASSSRRLVAIAASTGGPGALAIVLRDLGLVDAPVLVVQHIEPRFVEGLTTWLNRETPLEAVIATPGELVSPAHVYVAPGGGHLRVGSDWRVHIDPKPAGLHVPSADELFRSVAESAGAAGVGALLTGMGKDGAKGLLELRRAGGATVAQDEETSVVWGMPGEASRLGAAERILPLEAIGEALRRAVAGTGRPR